MKKLSSIASEILNGILVSRVYAIFLITLLAIIPFTPWLGSVLIGFITLRKGAKYSFSVLVSAILAFAIKKTYVVPIEVGLLKGFLVFLPCYLLAQVLRTTSDWQRVAKGAFALVFLMSLSIKLFLPESSQAIFAIFKSVVHDVQPQSPLDDWLQGSSSQEHQFLADYLIGLQLLMVTFGGLTALMFARSIQGRLFYRGGFQKEMRNFKGEKQILFLLGFIAALAVMGNTVAMNMIPVLLLYFILAGVSLVYHAMARKKPFNRFLLLLIPVFIIPYVILPLYLLFGTLDSLFNFRVYLSTKTE